MSESITWLTQTLWRNGLAVVPMALCVWVVVRWGVRRPATRHALWLGALLWLVAALLLPPVAFPAGGTDDSDAIRPPAEPLSGDVALQRPSPDAIADGRVPDSAPRYVPYSRTGRNTWSNHDDADSTIGCDAATASGPSSVCVAGEGENTSAPSIGEVGRSALPDPTPPTAIARPEAHALSHQIAAHGSVGQSPPFEVAETPAACAPPPSEPGAPDDIVVCRAAAVPEIDLELDVDLVVEPGGSSGLACAEVDPAADSEVSEGRAMVVEFANSTPMTPLAHADHENDSELVRVCRDTGTPDAAFAALSGWKAWIGPWVRIRDSLGELPAMPALLWFGVAALLAAIKATACIRFHRRLRRSRPAPHGVCAMVRACADSIGLKDAPETLFVSDCVSPMVVCGWRPRLILPVALWSELDPAGRRAVIVHELAHLRRRDHLTHWLDCLIGVIYWWHPVIWWVRQRLRDEAENACDAWVTWFDPRERRAYATALLQARTFLSERRRSTLVPAVGVMSPQAKQFSRRLTMVMTNRVSPRAYSMGMLAIPVMFLAAWVSMPAYSSACPPEADEAAEPTQLIHVVPAEDGGEARIIVKRDGDQLEAGELVIANEVGQELLVRPVTGGAVLTVSDGGGRAHAPAAGGGRVAVGRNAYAPRAGRDADERIERLERQMAELSEKLSLLLDQRAASRGIHPAPTVPNPPLVARVAPRTPSRPVPMGLYPTAPQGGEVVRLYQLPEDKLAALTKLMSRSDVPTRVRAVAGGLEVHASEADQAKFAAFVEMISGEGMNDTKAYYVSKGKLDDLTALMALDDVPVMIEYGDDDIKVRGGGLIQKTFRDFADLIDPEGRGARRGSRAGFMSQSNADQLRHAAALGQYQVAASNAQALALRRQAEAAEAAHVARLRDLDAEAARHQAEADRLERQANELESKIDALESRLDDGVSDREAAELKAMIKELEQVAAALEAEMESLYRKSAQLDAQAEEVEEALDESHGG